MLITLFTFALLASAITANKYILYYIDPTFLVALRMFFAGLILYFYTLINKNLKIKFIDIKNNIYSLLLIIFTTTFIPSILKAYSLKNMVSSKMAFFGALDPFITAILAYFILNEKLNLRKIIAILLAFLGSLILIFDNFNFNSLRILSYPEFAIILSVFITRYGWIMAQKLLKNNIFKPIQLNSITMLLSGLFSFLLVFIFDTGNYKILYTNPNNLDIFIFYTIIVGNLLSYNLYAYLLKKHSAIYISIASFSVPIFVSLYGFIFLSENLSIRFILSFIVTFIGLILLVTSENNKTINN